MKQNVLALSVAMAVAGFAGSAFAVTDYVAPTATALELSKTGTGHILVVPYYSVQAGNKTLLSITNTDTVNGKAVKVRFRGASNSDDVNDFQVFLSPGDVWTADIHQAANGLATLVTSDKSCTKPLNVNGDFSTFRFNPLWDADRQARETREGYIEILNMADIAPGSDMFAATKHLNGVAACDSATIAHGTAASAAAWTFIDGNPLKGTARSTADLNGEGLVGPTTGLMANWTIINVPNATAWSGAATAVEALDVAGGVPDTGAVVYFPQVDQTNGGDLGTANLTPLAITDFTADPLLTSLTGVPGNAQFDLPDLSTTYVGAALNPNTQAVNLANALQTSSVSNEFWTLTDIFGATDWVFSMPTRRYAVAVNYGSPSFGVQNPANTTHFQLGAGGNVVLDTTADQLCVTKVTWNYWDREESSPAAPVAETDTSRSPGGSAPTLPLVAFCGETSVLSFNDADAGTAPTKVLGAQVAVRNFNLTIGGNKVEEGWLRLATPGNTASGLPILGSAFMFAFNKDAMPGVSGNYNMIFPHRTTR